MVRGEEANASPAAATWTLMAAMETFVAKHAAKIRGTLCCFDRVLFRGYLPLMSGWAMAEFLRSKRIERLTLKPFLLEQAERIKKHAGVMASQTGRPYQYLSEPARKEDLARDSGTRSPHRESLEPQWQNGPFLQPALAHRPHALRGPTQRRAYTAWLRQPRPAPQARLRGRCAR
jgi:hypothetical protein